MSTSDNAADILQSYFERSAANVHRAFSRLEKTYLTPVIGFVSRSFQKRPISSTFLAIFLSLSFLPTLSFIGFSLFAFGALTSLALAGSFLVSTIVIGIAGFLLVCTFVALFVVAFILTGSALVVFLAARLLLLVRADGPRTGVAVWTKETKTRLYKGGRAIAPASGVETEGGRLNEEEDDDSYSNASVGSTVVVPSATDSNAPGNYSPTYIKQELK